MNAMNKTTQELPAINDFLAEALRRMNAGRFVADHTPAYCPPSTDATQELPAFAG